jgi:lipid II isoglutaminyl synthase (glutamine-hydrolysing)
VTVSARESTTALPGRAVVAVGALKLSNGLSRALGRGRGTVAGGRVGLALEPRLLGELARGRRVALVSGTNGKTTTTRMLVAALSGDGRPIATNDTGANMPAGHVAALAGSVPGSDAVLEVDEGYLGTLIEETVPRVVVLLNLSRDQLDRISEVRMLADRWRSAFGAPPHGRLEHHSLGTVVANADDPLVAWAAGDAPDVVWVGAGQVWRNDAVGCPACGGGIDYGEHGDWRCDRCELARPALSAWLEGSELVTAQGQRYPIDIRLPGQFNRANACMVAMAASVMDELETPATALSRLSKLEEVEGRFARMTRRGANLRLLLAKNPAGWTAIFDLLEEGDQGAGAVVLSINARVADGHDPSWLWDVPFERLAGRQVVITGDRRHDLAVRLRYAEVPCTVVADPLDALDQAIDSSQTAGNVDHPAIDFIGNYTAFAELRNRL